MTPNEFFSEIALAIENAGSSLDQLETYFQLGIVALIFLIAFGFARLVKGASPWIASRNKDSKKQYGPILGFVELILFPLTAILLLRIAIEVSAFTLDQSWVVSTALAITCLAFYWILVRDFVAKRSVARLLRWIGIPILLLYFTGLLDEKVEILDSISLSLGNLSISIYDVVRAAVFGSILFWIGRLIIKFGRGLIFRQDDLDLRTREVFTKLMEMAVIFIVFLLILQVMGINLTALAVFGGALGVGLGFGLQAIASNFISGIIILLDRSISIGDYVELEDGRTGVVRQLGLRSTTLETFNGQDIVVPNEKFIVNFFTNWTHKDTKQRYRVDFSVAYGTNVRALVEIIKAVVCSHPQVLSGDHLPLEMRPDCEIDSFGDSGINMFVEFWMEGIDDGKNRVGGDLMLMIYEAMNEHGFAIPFPQREVRVINEGLSVQSPKLVPK